MEEVIIEECFDENTSISEFKGLEINDFFAISKNVLNPYLLIRFTNGSELKIESSLVSYDRFPIATLYKALLVFLVIFMLN